MGRKGQSNRQRIIRAADELFYHQGYNQTSFSDIAAEAALSRGNFYYYFKAKDDILAAVIDQRCESIRARLRQWDGEHADPRERLKCFVRMPRLHQDEIVRYGCPIGTLGTELSKADNWTHGSLRPLFDLYRAWLVTQFQALGAGARAPDLALHALALTQGLSLVAHVYGDPTVIQEETERAEAWIDSV